MATIVSFEERFFGTVDLIVFIGEVDIFMFYRQVHMVAKNC